MKIKTLTINKEFKHAYYQGKYKAHPYVVTYVIKNKKNMPRLGITTSKKVGCAVLRNRARRIIKQAYRELLKEGAINSHFDYVFVARADTIKTNTPKIKAVMKKHIELLTK